MLHYKSVTSPTHKNNQPLWTQDEAIAFESARETIGHLMAIYSALMDKEKMKPTPDWQQIMSLKAKRSALALERTNLNIKDYKDIARIEQEYGLKIKDYNEEGICPL